MYKLLIIDDEPLVQAGIRSMLSWEELGIDVCGIAANGQAGWELMEQEHPDIIITDVKMPIMSGLELLKKTREHYPQKAWNPQQPSLEKTQTLSPSITFLRDRLKPALLSFR